MICWFVRCDGGLRFSTGKVSLLLCVKNKITYEVLQTIYDNICANRERERESYHVRNGLADINSFYIKSDDWKVCSSFFRLPLGNTGLRHLLFFHRLVKGLSPGSTDSNQWTMVVRKLDKLVDLSPWALGGNIIKIKMSGCILVERHDDIIMS